MFNGISTGGGVVSVCKRACTVGFAKFSELSILYIGG